MTPDLVPEPTWDTASMQLDFEVLGFAAPYVVVRRRSDSVVGTLVFNHYPRLYYGWSQHPGTEVKS